MTAVRERVSDAAVRRAAHRWSMRMHGDDAAAHRAAFEQWQAADPRHRAAYARLDQQWQQAGLLAQTRVGRARSLPERRAVVWEPSLRYALAAALITALVALAMLAGRTTAPDGRTAPVREVASRLGEIRTLHLTDGSSVTLDTDSAVRVAYTPEVRRILLVRGRARFDVAHNPKRPFVVAAGNGTVTARGTVFDVSLVDGHVGVTLLRGVVDVREGDAPKIDKTAVRLRAGERTHYAPRLAPVAPRPALSTETDWVSGMLSFDGERLGDALVQANRYSAVKIGVADPALGELRITGAYRVGDAAAFARTLAASLDLQAMREPDGRILLSRPD